jgi:hypothetical protein
VRHLRWCEELFLVLNLDIVGCLRGRTPLLIEGALLACFLEPLLIAIVIISYQITALLSPAHLVFLMNALRELSHRTLQAIQGLKSE